MELLKWVVLISPLLSSWLITLWMGIGESWLVWHCCQCTIVVVIGTCCSSISSCLISSLQGSCTKSLLIPLRILDTPSPKTVYAKAAWSLWASHNGVLLPLIPGQAHFNHQHSQLLGSPCHSRNTNGNWRYCNFTLVSTRSFYYCGYDEPDCWIHTVQ